YRRRRGAGRTVLRQGLDRGGQRAVAGSTPGGGDRTSGEGLRLGHPVPLQRQLRAGRAVARAEGRQGRAAPYPFRVRPGRSSAAVGLRIRALDGVPREARGGHVPRAVGRGAALVAVFALVCASGCTSSSAPEKEEKPDSAPAAPYRGNSGYDLPDSPFTREGTVVTATCSMGARYAGVDVQAWDAE